MLQRWLWASASPLLLLVAIVVFPASAQSSWQTWQGASGASSRQAADPAPRECLPAETEACRLAAELAAGAVAGGPPPDHGFVASSNTRVYASGPELVVDYTSQLSIAESKRAPFPNREMAFGLITSLNHRSFFDKVCATSRHYVGKGVVFHYIHRYADGPVNNEAFVRTCAPDETTWDPGRVSACAPFGYEVCGGLVTLAADLKRDLLQRPAMSSGSTADFVLRDARAEGNVLVLEQNLRWNETSPDLPDRDRIDRDAVERACTEPLSTRVDLGAQVRFDHFYADGKPAGSTRIVRCRRSTADTSKTPPPPQKPTTR